MTYTDIPMPTADDDGTQQFPFRRVCVDVELFRFSHSFCFVFIDIFKHHYLS